MYSKSLVKLIVMTHSTNYQANFIQQEANPNKNILNTVQVFVWYEKKIDFIEPFL